MARKRKKHFSKKYKPHNNNNNHLPAQIAPLKWFEEVFQTRQIKSHHIIQAYHLNQVSCPKTKKKKNCVNNPNCLFGLGEGKQIRLQDIIGPDPSSEGREENSFCGLKNLGATCYMNCLLQCLFMNTVFRQGLYDWKPNEKNPQPGDEIILQLQSLFAKLQYTVYKFVDPSDFTSSIALKSNIQQDPQEFFSLLSSLLEEKFGKSENENIRNLIQDQFQGEIKYTTTCKNCQNASSRNCFFNSLELSIKGNSTLEECILEYTKDEHLSGADQYFCDTCHSKQDATRSITIVKLPPVLNVQLLRFVYDQKTAKKTKLKTRIKFPLTLDFTQILSKLNNSSESFPEYELCGILVHKGQSAYGGHYIAHIRNELDKKSWFKFDDENVTLMNDTELKSIDEGEEDKKNSNDSEKSPNSCNAYMLIYTAKNRTLVSNPKVPDSFITQFESQNQLYLNKVIEYNKQKDIEKSQIENHKKLYTEIFRSIHCNESTKVYYWIELEWFKHWISGSKVKEIDNTKLLCAEHGKLDPKKLTEMKRISESAWNSLVAHYGGGPAISNISDYFPCEDCIIQLSEVLNENKENEDTKQSIAKLISSSPNIKDGYWVSKQWLKEWGKKSPNLEGDLTQDILCSHENLCLESQSRRLIPTQAWSYFSSLYPKAKEFPSSCSPCEICKEESIREEKLMKQRKEEREKEKKFFHELYHNDNLKINSEIFYYLIPKEWYETWKSYLDNPEIEEKPAEIDNSIFVCEHDQLKYDPSLFLLSGKSNLEEYPFVLVSESSWKLLKEKYNGNLEIKGWLLNEESQSQPLICKECLEKQAKIDLEKKLNYTDAHLFVIKREKEAPKNSENDGFVVVGKKNKHKNNSSSHSYSTRSKEAPKSIKIEPVNCNQTLQTLKLQIYQETDIAPFQQTLFYNGQPLENDEWSLSMLNITPRTTLYLEKKEENSDVLEDDSSFSREVEEGFKGTALHSNFSSSNKTTSSSNNSSEEEEEEEEDSEMVDLEITNETQELKISKIDLTSEEKIWGCSECTLHNSITTNECEACGHKRCSESFSSGVLKRISNKKRKLEELYKN